MEEKKSIPQFKGEKAVIALEYNPNRDLLRGEFGEYIYDKVQTKYGRHVSIKQVKFNNKSRVVEGSNHPFVVAVNEFIRPLGLYTATERDIRVIRDDERITKRLGLRGKYVDIAKVLRGSNPYYHAKDLPVTINLCDFDLVEQEGGLVEVIRRDAHVIQGDNAEVKGHSYVNGLFLVRDLYLLSSRGDPTVSFSGGRVVVVGGRSTQNFNQYILKLEETTEDLVREYTERLDRIISQATQIKERVRIK